MKPPLIFLLLLITCPSFGQTMGKYFSAKSIRSNVLKADQTLEINRDGFISFSYEKDNQTILVDITGPVKMSINEIIDKAERMWPDKPPKPDRSGHVYEFYPEEKGYVYYKVESVHGYQVTQGLARKKGDKYMAKIKFNDPKVAMEKVFIIKADFVYSAYPKVQYSITYLTDY